MSNSPSQAIPDDEVVRRNAIQLEPDPQSNGEIVKSIQRSPNVHGETQDKEEPAGEVLANTEKTSQKQIGSMMVYKRIFQTISMTDRLLYLCGIICSIGSGTVFPLMTLIFGSFVTVFTDFAVGKMDSSAFRGKIDHYTSMTLFSIVSNRVTATFRRSYLRAALHKDITFHERDSSSGTVSLALSSHCNTIQSGLSDKFGLSLQCASTVVAAFVVAFSTQWKLTLVTATVVPATVICVGVTAIFDSKFEDAISTTNSEAATLAEEILSSIRTVYALRATEKLLVKYKSYLDDAVVVGWKRTPIVGLQTGTYMFMIYGAYALAFWYGVQLFVKGEARSSGAVITTLFAIILGTNAFSQLAAYLAPFLKISSAGAEVFQVIGNQPIPDQACIADDHMSPIGHFSQQPIQQISFSKVHFSYPLRPNVPVLSDLTLDFVPGSMTALVGPSGSGKSTIVGLVERWYDVTAGKIDLNGCDIKDIPLKALRERIGLVTQEPFLFSTTVKDNILYGLSDRQMASLSETEKSKLVVEACKLANAHDYIQKLPNGYDTFVGNRATLLSGGQKQRLAIARAIIGNPSVLILDEATSALDPESERIVQHALDKASEGRTTIVIAHRLSTIRHASKIVVLTEGKIVEEGSHQELVLKTDGIYKKLLSAQSLLHNEPSDLAGRGIGSKALKVASSETEKFAGHQNDLETANGSLGQRKESSFGLGKTMLAIFSDQKRYWVAYTALFSCCVIGGALFPLQAFLYAKIVSAFQLPISELLSRGNFWALMFLVLSICAGFAYFVIAAAGSGLGEAITQFYRYSYITSMTNQPVAFFDAAENSSGSLISRLATDPDSIRSLGGPNLGVMTVVGVSIISTMLFSLAVGWKLALVAIFGAFPFVFGAGLLRATMEHKFEETTAKTFAESVGFASECVQAIKTVSALNMETRVDASFGRLLDENCARARHHAVRSMTWFALSESLDMLCMGLTFWYGGTLLATREYSTTQFFIVFVAIVLSAQSSGQFFAHSLDLSKGHVASNSIRALKQSVLQDNEIKHGFPSLTEDQEKRPLIEFRDVTFTYPARPTNPVLSGLNISVKKGQFVAIVGPSGCGKSTIISLLERFYNIDNGHICFNGVDIQNLLTDELRKQFALVSQEPTLFQGTIRENILLSTSISSTTNSTNSSTTETSLLDNITKAAQIYDLIISLPSGYETQVGSRGTALSGGQKQRLAIARAMAQRDAEVLLLDEATSALDSGSEALILDALKNAGESKTVIAVAHRLSTIQHADVIYVLGSGRVVEQGTHGELLTRKGVYFRMCEAQGLESSVIESN